MNRRLIGLVLALVLAGVATLVLVNYVRTADERAREAEELTAVFVAQEDIPAGTSADNAIAQGLITRDEVPTRAVPSGAVAQLDQVAGQVVALPIFEGEVIVTQRFGATVAQGQDAFEVPDGFQAVSVQVGVVPGVAGFVDPGDTVSIVAVLDAPGEEDDDEEATGTGTRVEYLLQNVEVLVVGQRVLSTEEGEESSSIQRSNDNFIFTLALEAEDVERLVFARTQGDVTFTLLPDDEQPEANTPGRTLENAFS